MASVTAASVIVCTYDRPELLARLLASLTVEAKSTRSEWELIVVDNGADPRTESVTRSLEESLPLRLVRERRVGKSWALNAGLAAARGDLLLFADDDVEVRPGWIAAFLRAANAEPDAGWFGGRSIPRWAAGTPSWARRDLPEALRGYVCDYDLGPSPRYYEPRDLRPIGASMAVRADTFAATGGYDPMLGPRGTDRGVGDDTELIERAMALGVRGFWVPDAVVDHFVPATRLRLRSLFRYGRIKGAQQAMQVGRRGRRIAAAQRVLDQFTRGLFQILRGQRGKAAVCALNAGLAWGAASRRSPFGE